MSDLFRKFQTGKKLIVALFLVGSVISGFVAFAQFVIPRSKPADQLLFGLSASRLLLAAIWLGLLLLNLGVIWLLFRQKGFEQKALDVFTQRQALILGILYAGLFLIGAFLLFNQPPVLRPFRFLASAYIRLGGFLTWVFIVDLLLVILLRYLAAETLKRDRWVTRLDTFFGGLGLFCLTIFLYWQVAFLINWVNKSRYAFWDLLVAQLLQGKLYIENPPYTHDLTLYNGKWYVPMPPLPAFVMLPIAYLLGVEEINPSLLSIVYSAINGVLVFLVLRNLAQRKWLELSWNGIFWLMVVFLFGTPHLWVGISGRGWYVSQILTVLCLALSVYAALRAWPAWVVGAFLGLAMLARPNSLMTWPLVFAISMQILRENEGKASWKQAFSWSLKSAIPVALAVLTLMTYNYLRFGDIRDFGYTTVNAGPDIVGNVQKYGLFSPYFVPNNLYVMFLKLPQINWGTPWPVEPKGALWPIDPTTTGMSVFATTPVFLYLFRRYSKQWWILGAWAAVLCNLVMLSLYSNTGAHQFGYRYVLDFITPLLMMLAVGVGKKVPWHFILLTLFSIVINIYGAYWFMNG